MTGSCRPTSAKSSPLRTKKIDLPDRDALEARPRRRQLERVPPEVDAGAHGGEHAGDAERLCGQEGEVAAEDRDRDLDRRVVDAPSDLADDEADREADRDPACDAENEAARRGEAARSCRLTTAMTAERYATSAVPSLTRLSPSIRPRRAAAAARAASRSRSRPSDRSARRSRRARTRRGHERPGMTSCATTATSTIVRSTRPTASSDDRLRCSRGTPAAR